MKCVVTYVVSESGSNEYSRDMCGHVSGECIPFQRVSHVICVVTSVVSVSSPNE